MPGEQFLANLDKGVPPFPPPDVIRDYVKQDCELIRGIGPDLVWSATCAPFAASAASGTLLKTPPVARPPRPFSPYRNTILQSAWGIAPERFTSQAFSASPTVNELGSR